DPINQATHNNYAFEDYGESLYPYGFKCRWVLGKIHEEQYDDLTWYFKVEVVIENAYGNKIDGVAEGTVKSGVVKSFYVNY
ncbi:MAG: hypothetical protein Q4B70_18335, partial [Lachnospiraceae bacterium]|nr:hypothetical protein [Lachnospiraceae bacterium]